MYVNWVKFIIYAVSEKYFIIEVTVGEIKGEIYHT